MATTQVVNLNVNTNLDDTTKKVGTLKGELRKAQQEVAELSAKFGATSKEAVEAAKRASELKDRIGDAKALTDAFNPDAKFKALTASLSGVAGGFSAVQGAIGLAGAESADLEKAMLKVQSAMALSQGVQALGESVDSFKQLKAVIVESSLAQKIYAGATALAGTVQKAFTGAVATTSTGFKVLRGAIISTGIGALVVGIGLLIANFDKVKKVVLNLVPGLASVGDFIGKIVDSVTDFVGVTSDATRAVDKMVKDSEGTIRKNQRFLDTQGDKYDEYTKRKIQANIDYAEKVKEVAKDETLTETEKLQYLKELRTRADRDILQADKDRQTELEKKRAEALAKEVEAENKRREKAKEIAEAKKAEAKRLEDLANELDAIVEADIKKAQDFEAEAREQNRLATLSDKEREIEIVKAKYDEKLALAEANGVASTELQIQQANEINQINLDFDAKEQARKQENDAKEIEDAKILAEAKKAIQDTGLSNVESGIASLKSLAGENKEIQKGLLIAESAIGIGKIIQNTQTAVSASVAQSPTTFGLPWSGVAIASGALGVAANISATSKALGALGGGSAPSGNVGGGQAGGGGAPATPNFNVVGNSGVNQLANQVGKRESTPIRAYVVASDQTKAEAINRNIVKNATIGG